MKLSDFLIPADVIIDVRVQQKQQLLHELSRRADASLGLQADYVASELLKREDLGSTGMGNGVAIPHARLPMVKRPHGIVARLKPPLDLDAIDGQPVDLVFILLLPPPPEADQLTALALVARTLKAPGMLVRLRQAKSASDLYVAMTE
jgi:PTS system nitrogen regulatory IIA component